MEIFTARRVLNQYLIATRSNNYLVIIISERKMSHDVVNIEGVKQEPALLQKHAKFGKHFWMFFCFKQL